MTRSFAIESRTCPGAVIVSVDWRTAAPERSAPANIFEPRYLNMVLDALAVRV
ncbi:MAG: hypothetical protein Ct9H300mP14_04060 [Gammaproteobacteria bacterium]|nr:MAG: hypothetical protein Ct9H300mP14_04060 [Gammaproteobacteria bacterium]